MVIETKKKGVGGFVRRHPHIALAACGALSCAEPSMTATSGSNTEGVAPPAFLHGPGESSSGTATMTWGPSTTPDVSYQLEHRTGEAPWQIGYEGPDTTATIRIAIDGTHEIRVRACVTPSLCSPWTPPHQISVLLVFPEFLQSTCPGPVPGALPPQEYVGAVDGKGGVRSGVATYAVSIIAPPGRRGLAPSVALAYSSSGGDGLAGMGWSLAAASQIARCGRTPAQDGTTLAIDFGPSDRLCLDGNRLVLVSGQYGASGSVYRTERERFDRITLHGDLESMNPVTGAWFEVEHKAGRKSFYGAFDGRSDATELLAGAPAPVAWWLARTQDARTNTIEYVYRTYDDTQIEAQPVFGQHVLDRIRYTGLGTVPGDREVVFEYAARTGDRHTAYHAGAMRRSTRILSAIETRVQGALVRRYELTHTPSRATNRSLLTQVVMCHSSPCAPSTSLPPTTFEYQDEPPSFEWVDLSTNELVTVRVGADYDGDGTRDIFETEKDDPFGSPTRYDLQLSATGAILDLQTGPGAVWQGGFERILTGLTPWHNTDFDQDGITDLLGVESVGGTGYFAIRSLGATRVSNRPMSFDTMAQLYVADFDGNGRQDLLWKASAQGYVLALQDKSGELHFTDNPNPFPFVSHRQTIHMIADFDGNGLPDAFVDWDGDQSPPETGDVPRIVFTHPAPNGVSHQDVEASALGAPLVTINPPGTVPALGVKLRGAFADINGDGLLDIRAPGNRIYVNTGAGFRFAGGGSGSVLDESEPRYASLLADVNSDGRTDALRPGDVVFEWCVQLLDALEDGAGYDLPYCSVPVSPGIRTFAHSEAPKHLDRTVREWDAVVFVDDGTGQFTTAPSTATGIVGVTPRAFGEDHGGDGLTDIGSLLKQLYGAGPDDEPIPMGWYPPNQPGFSYGSKLSRQTGGAPDLLVRSQDGLGVESRWTYAPLSATAEVAGCDSPQELPLYRVNHSAMEGDHDRFLFRSSMSVVAKYESSDGVGGLAPTCYRYEDALADNQGRGFLGFGRVVEEDARLDPTDPTQWDPTNLRRTMKFHLDWPFSGTLRETAVHLATDPEDAAPIARTLHSVDAVCEPSSDLLSITERCFVYEKGRVETNRDLVHRGWVSTSTTVYGYEGPDLVYGNISWEEVATEDAEVRYVVRTDYEYDYADAASWWIDKLVEKRAITSSVQYQEAPLMLAATNPENDTKTARDEYQYYPLGHVWSRAVSQEDNQRGVAHQWQTKVYDRYDAFGNLLEVHTTAADAPAPRSQWFTYTADGYFLSESRNPLNHSTTSMDVDRATGRPLLAQDPLGRTTSTVLDPFGSILEVSTTGLPTVFRRTRWCSACPDHGVYEIVTRQDGSPTRTEVKDLLGRTIQVRETAFDSQQESVVVTQYDARGHSIATSQPTADPGGAYFTRYEGFDALGRPARKISDRTGHVDADGQPDETFTVEYAYDGLSTTITLEGTRTAHRKVDAFGRLLETTDTAGKRTVFRHDARGRTLLVRDPEGNELRAGFDELGRKTWMSDPNRGDWSFSYDGYGQLRRQVDGNGAVVDMDYDVLDRLTERRVNGVLEARYTYDVAAPGLPHGEEKLDGSGGILFTRTYGYDALRRLETTTESFDAQTFTSQLAYNCHGQVRGIRYPGGEAVDLWYSPHGFLLRETDPTGVGQGPVYREILSMNARGQVTRERFGNGLEGLYTFIDSTGDPVRLCVGDMADPCVDARQDLRYGYEDPWGNLTFAEKYFHDPARYGALASVREAYVYDDRFRLTEAKRTWTGTGQGDETIGYGYDALGNLTRKDDYASAYLYGDATRSLGGNAGPHAVRSVTKLDGSVVDDFEYDANGNMTAGDGRRITYTWMNKPETITEGASTTTFQYGPSHARYRQDAPGRIVRYVGGSYEEVVTAGVIEEKSYVGTSAMIIRPPGLGRSVRYLHRDRLGSIESVTNESGELVESHGFDPFGQPRTSTWEDGAGLLHNGEFTSEATTRGFTGHEHLDEHRLVHMNGRAYDPALGRFLSVDPFVQNPEDLQSLNPYSYVLNNPLMGTDPSGYNSVCRGANRASPGCNPFGSLERVSLTVVDENGTKLYDIVGFRDTETGAVVALVTDAEKKTSFYIDETGQAIDPSDIGGTLSLGVRRLEDLASSRTNLRRMEEQYKSGDPAWERTSRLLKTHGAVLLSPLAALVVIQSFNASFAYLVGQFGSKAIALFEMSMEVMLGLGEQTMVRYAVAGAGGAGAKILSSAADEMTRAAKPLLSEAADLGGRAAGSGDDIVDLYRFVGQAELDDIARTGSFAFGEGMMEAKQFGVNYDEVLRLSNHFDDAVAIIRARVHRSAIQGLDTTPVDQFILRSGSVTARGLSQLRLLNESIVGQIERVL